MSLPQAATDVRCGPLPAKAGIGLRFQHHQAVVDVRPDVAWLEVHTENYLGGGAPPHYLETIRAEYPISFHGVGLSLGSADGLDCAHLERIRGAVARFEPALVSEHLSWSAVGGVYLADLLPLPMTEEALAIVCRHVDQMQASLQRRILIENPSTYLRYRHSTIPEWEFIATVAARTGCGILCDVNNIFVSACNHGWDASTYLAALPAAAIGEIHLAGHSVRQLAGGVTLRIDDHGSRVIPEVWALYAEALARFAPVPTLIEWDTNVPPLDVLLDEAAHATAALERAGKEFDHAEAA
ncbi:MAG: MNIO family bufferin maturase [Steroidobacteraceae bacterium]